MSDIFISYSKDDRPLAKTLAQALEAEGWSVWWDPQIPGGKIFDDVIQDALDQAKCVIVVWSSHSVGSKWVRTEAAEGAERNILIPVLIEDVRIPLAFRRIQTENFIKWDGTRTSRPFLKLMADISGILGPPPHQVTQETKEDVKDEQRVMVTEQVLATNIQNDLRIMKLWCAIQVASIWLLILLTGFFRA